MIARQRSSRALQTLRLRWWTFFHKRCLVGFPWSWPGRPPGRRAMIDARRMVRWHFGRDHDAVPRAFARILAATAWPPAVLLHLWQIRRYWGPKEVPIKLMPGAFWAALRHNILPGEYYAYELWRPDRRAKIDNYLYSNEAARLFKLLNQPSEPDPIGDKLAFYEMCTAHGLPTPAVLAAFGPTGTLLDFESGRPPEHDLFVKPRLGLAGEGTERFGWRGLVFESNVGGRIKPEDLGSYLLARAQIEKRALLVQPVLANHPNLSVEKSGPLATARLVTGISCEGDVVPIFGFIYFGRSNRIIAQHGEVALIDVASGLLMPTPLEGSYGSKLSNQQLDKGSDEACVLPGWNAALQQAKIAHEACSNFTFVGWDIAFTDQGPKLLEGNSNWTADEFQSLTGRPLGDTKFADILEARLKNCPSDS